MLLKISPPIPLHIYASQLLSLTPWPRGYSESACMHCTFSYLSQFYNYNNFLTFLFVLLIFPLLFNVVRLRPEVLLILPFHRSSMTDYKESHALFALCTFFGV